MSYWRDMEEQMGDPHVGLLPPQSAVENRVDMAFQQLENNAQQVQVNEQVLTDVEMRLHKANMYRIILENRLINSDDQIADEVENEIRDFVVNRLSTLMGLQAEVKVQSQFSDEEAKALKLWANKLMGKPAIMKVEPVKVEPAKPPAPQAPSVNLVQAPTIRRGRGRPPGTGKHQIAAQMAQPQQPTPVATPTKQEKVVEVDGKKVTLNVTQQAKPVGVKPAPMPSPQEMLAMGAMQAAALEVKADGALRGIVTQAKINGKEDLNNE